MQRTKLHGKHFFVTNGTARGKVSVQPHRFSGRLKINFLTFPYLINHYLVRSTCHNNMRQRADPVKSGSYFPYFQLHWNPLPEDPPAIVFHFWEMIR